MEANSAPVSIVLAASAFAAHKHRDQRRKGADASPYINHPIAVANVLANEAGITDPTVLAAALLHDTIEDTDTTLEELEAAFGPKIAAIVLEVTDDKALDKPVRKQLQIEHAATLSHAGPAREIRRQDLQRPRHESLAAGGLVNRAPGRIFRLGQASGRSDAGRIAGIGTIIRRGACLPPRDA